MSEQIDPNAQARANHFSDEDPLAELARIVSGEEETIESSAVNTPQVQVQNSPDLNEADTVEFEATLESQLMRELGGPVIEEQSAYTTTTSRIVPPPEPANDVIPVAEGASEADFNDELLDALNAELNPPPPASSATPPAPATSPASVAEAAADPFPVETGQPVEDESLVEAESLIEAFAMADQSENQAGATADLGDAFNAEFAQLMQSTEAEPVQELSPDEIFTESANTVRETLSSIQQENDTAALPVESNAASDEAFEVQFGATLADELGVESLTPSQGWEEQDTIAAKHDFAETVVTRHSPAIDPGHADDLSHLDTGSDLHGSEPASAKGSSKRYALAALGIALIAGLASAGYGFFGTETSSDTPVPVIRADSDPVKVKPADPGGRQIANQDKASYDKVSGSQEEISSQTSLISNTEEPADLSLGQKETFQLKSDDRLVADDNATDSVAIGGIAPRKVKTVTVKPDGTIMNSSLALLGINAPTIAGEAGNEIPVMKSELATISPIEAIDDAATTGEIGTPTLSPLPKPVEKVVIQQVAVKKPLKVAALNKPEPALPSLSGNTGSEWVVQVSSQRSEDAAQASFNNLQKRFSSIFNGREAGIKKAIIKDKGTFYRVRVNMASKNDASSFCARFKAAGGSCFVTR